MEWLSSLEQTEAEKSVFSLGRGSNNTTNNNNKNNSHVSEEDLGHFDAKSESHFGDDEHLDANKYYNSEKSGFLKTSKYKNNNTNQDDSSSHNKQNTGIPLGVLKQHLPMWSFLCNSIRNKTTADRVLSIIKDGYKLEFEESPPTSRVVQNNYLHPGSMAGPWVTEQIRILLSQHSIRQVDRMEALMILPLFVVPKGEGGFRLIVDMRALNAFLKKRGFRLPTLSRERAEYNDILGFWTYDLTSAYQHVEIAQEHQCFFGITWQGSTYLMNVCPYGCSSIPEMFQTVAGIPLLFLEEFGFCPDLDTPSKWLSVAAGVTKLPPASRRFRVPTSQYLDDFGSRLPKRLRSLNSSQLIVDVRVLRQLGPLLSQSFCALYQACGFAVSSKSRPNPFTTNIFLGYEIVVRPTLTLFQIPERKRAKSISYFLAALEKDSLTLREMASLAGKILRWKLVWAQYASLYARSIYHQIADMIRAILRRNKTPNWSQQLQLNPLSRAMVQRAIELLQPGKRQLIRAPVLCMRETLENLWEEDSWASLPDTADKFVKILSDASDHAGMTWVSTLDMDETLAADEFTIISEMEEFSKWSLLQESEIDTGSTYRELIQFKEAYSDKAFLTRLMELLKARNINSTSRVGMIHLTDAKSACTLLRKGSSRHPHLHLLVLEIYDLTRTLRHHHGWCVGWIRREKNKTADYGSKGLHDWQVLPAVFATLQSEFHFTCDAFASESERPNKSLPFCSRYVADASLGDARVVSWDTRQLWCFPPANLLMISLALRKWSHSAPGTKMVLCIPSRHSADYWPVVWNSPWKSFRSLPPGSLFRIQGLADDNTLARQLSKFRCTLFVFDK